jgi:pimeloyl-ACP methyl ester carboxylesterase
LTSDSAPDDVFDEIRSIVAELHPVATKTAIRAFAAADLRGVLADIDVPTLLVYGEDDVRAPRDVWHPLHSTLCDSKLVLVPGVGHMIDLEAGDRLNTEIRSFLGAVPG